MSALPGPRLGTWIVSMILSGRCAHLQSGCFTILSCRIHNTGYCGLSIVAKHQGMLGHAQIQIPPNYALGIEPMTPFLGINVCRQTHLFFDGKRQAIAAGNPPSEMSPYLVHIWPAGTLVIQLGCARSVRFSLVCTARTHSTASTRMRLPSYIGPLLARRRQTHENVCALLSVLPFGEAMFFKDCSKAEEQIVMTMQGS